MAEALKDVYRLEFLQSLARKIKTVWREFQEEAFVGDAMGDDWESLELKQRMRRITLALGHRLPPRYEEALDILLTAQEGCVGFPYLIFPDFVEVYGQADEHWDISIKALEVFTKGSSAEFAVRPFILRDPERMMRQMQLWSMHENEHVRRLASEGCRPRLPWAAALPMFKKDPAPIFPVLEPLKEDPSLYVRKSVANNLNDIAKDHPSLVLETARRWKGRHPHTDWIVRRGCRTLIRNAVPEALALFGYAENGAGDDLVSGGWIQVDKSAVPIGGTTKLAYEVRIREGEPATVRIEYAIDFVKSQGRVSRKKFLLSDKTVSGGANVTGERNHSWSDLSTRRHYPGLHRVALLVNGREVAHAELELTSR